MDVERDLREFVVKNFFYGDDAAGLEGADSFIERGIIDSTGVLEIVNFLESRFAITLRDDELVPDNLDSIDRIARFVARKRSEAGGAP
jgi:acyl carrier protein